jgi:uncharacterized membrane protein
MERRMTILQIDPAAPQWVHMAANTLLYAHIGGGTLGMISGAVALASRKGETIHRAAGNVFFAAMLAMAGVGATVAPFIHERASVVAGILALYLISTGWMAVKRAEGTIGRFEVGAFIVATFLALSGYTMATMAAQSPTGTLDGQPDQAFYVFAIVGTIAALADLKVLLQRGISGAGRIARHLWRMCTALTLATASFFLGQQKMLPAFLHHSSLLFVPVLVPLLAMAFWLIYMRFRFKPAPALGET